MRTKAYDSKIQISQELEKKLIEFINTKKARLSFLQTSRQINIFLKQMSQNKNQLLGGGCCSSKSQIIQNDMEYINITDYALIENYFQNRKFEKLYNKWTNQEIIIENLQQEKQLTLQTNLIEQCIIDEILCFEEQLNFHKLQIQDIFETYIMVEMTRTTIKSEQKQEKYEYIWSEICSIKDIEQDIPIMELVFYAQQLTILNKINEQLNENQQKEITKIKDFIIGILNFNKNKNPFSSVVSQANIIKENIHKIYKKKEQFLLKFEIENLLKKIDQFGDKFLMQDIQSEILFYVKIFFEIKKQNDQKDQIILTLIHINYLLEKFQKDKSKLNKQIYKQFSNDLIKANIDEFLNELMQKSDLFHNKLFLIFSIENQYYRYITLSILINLNSIFTFATQNIQNQEFLLDFLSVKYLIEKELSVRVLFEKSTEFAKQFNQNVKSESFKLRLINFDKQRKNKLLTYFKSLEELEAHERSLNTFDDIIKLISDNAIQKWERDIKARQRQNIAKKDDVLLEVKDLYINQMITQLKGNQIFNKFNQNSNIEQYSSTEQNALQDIIKLFLNPNYSYRLKYLNNNKNLEKENENAFKDFSNQCQILGIIAEGGTGKSMFMKKIETFLIEKLSKLNTETETGNFLPLLVKCNSLDSNNPSLDDYFKQYGGLSQDQIENLKQNDRNKLILLDGYDEFSGEYFYIYKILNLNQWKNTKIIVTTRKERLSEGDACLYFSKQNDLGDRDEMSYSIVKLEEFTTKDIHEYAERYFKQERKTDKIDNDLKNLNDCLTENMELVKLLYLPINLYLFTRMLINLKEKDIQSLKTKIVSDQIGIQEIFFMDQFKREAQSFIDTHIHSIVINKNQEAIISQLKEDLDQTQQFQIGNQKIIELITNCYFEYFQTVAMKMFLNKRKKQFANFLQIQTDQIHFSMRKNIQKELSKEQQKSLNDKLINYVNSKIITRLKNQNQNPIYQNQSKIIEFKHKSLFEYFVARGMKYDFDIHQNNICNLSIQELKEFSINQKSIMNIGQNQSEQQILVKLYKLIQNEIESIQFQSNYCDKKIENNNRFIQYIKRSTIQKYDEISEIDIGASNLLSALFISKFSFRKLSLTLCSFSKIYICNPKSSEINFDRCNLNHANLQNSGINYDSCNFQMVNFDGFSKVYDSQDIYSFNKAIWGNNNEFYSISNSGLINLFNIVNSNIQLKQQKQLSQTPLLQIEKVDEENLLISSKFSLFLINSKNFEIKEYHKFKESIIGITIINQNIVVIFHNLYLFYGTFKDGFKQIKVIGSGCAYNKTFQILMTYYSGSFYLWNVQENFQLFNKIEGHDKKINSAAFSANGKYLATCSDDKTCKIWDVEQDFELINTIEGHTSELTFVAFSEDGKHLLTGSFDKTCKIWDVEKEFILIKTIEGHCSNLHTVSISNDGKFILTSSDKTCKICKVQQGFELLNTIQGDTYGIYSIVFSSNRKYLATSSREKYKIWSIEKGFELFKTIQGHDDNINSITFSSDGKYIATGSCDKTCKIWNTEKDFENIFTIKGHEDHVNSVAFSADTKYLATGSRDNNCKIWNAEKSFELIKTIKGHTSWIYSIAFSADSKYLATGSNDKTCKIWNAQEDFELIKSIEDHTKTIFTVAFSDDGKFLATGSTDKSCKIWNAQKGFEIINTIQDHSNSIKAIAFSSDGKFMATGSYDKTCKIWNIEKNFELINTVQGHNSEIDSVAFSAYGKFIATGSSDQIFKIWDTEKGFEFINTIQGHSSFIVSAAFSTDGKYLATGSNDQACKIWNAEKGFELVKTIQGHTSQIKTVAFSRNGSYLATGSKDNTCKLWSVEKGFKLISTIQGHTSWVRSVVFSSDGKYLATASDDKICKIWNAEKGFELINTMQGHTDSIFSVTFSADGKYIATGSEDTTCKIWNVEKGFKLIKTIDEHEDHINTVTFSQNGKYLATCSGSLFNVDDNTCKIWNAEKNFELIHTIEGHEDNIQTISFSVDGKYIITGSLDCICKIWSIENGFEIVNIIQDHTSEINSVIFSADGKYLLTCSGSLFNSSDITCKIWNAEKGFEIINKIQSQDDSQNFITYSEDDQFVCIKSNEQSYIIYDQQNFKILIQDSNDYEQLKEKYQLEQKKNNKFENIRFFENMYIL